MKQTVRSLWSASPPLAATTLLMALFSVLFLLLLGFDPRTLAGAPLWLKPLKFSVSVALYAATLALVLARLPEGRLSRATAWVSAVAGTLEVLLIALQAARGTGSHFNVGTPFDQAVFSTMGLGIFLLWAMGIATAVVAVRHRFTDPAWAAALRMSLWLVAAGAGVGWIMTTPRPSQLAEAQATHRLALSGAHSIGGPDGGPGLPLTHWSTTHGDLRVPHFVGLHALQVIPLCAWALRRSRQRLALVRIVGWSWAGLLGVTLQQALRGVPVASPDPVTLLLGALWLLGTAAAAALVLRAPVPALEEA